MTTSGWTIAAHLYALGAAVAARQPHIVFFLADDYGFADIGYHADLYGRANGTNKIRTPTLDQLSASGVRLENYYIQPVCSPTRATLLTGRYVFHHGVHVPFIDSSRSTLPLNETTLSERMKSAGYATAAVGKWHLGFRTWAHTPTERGFDSFYGYYAGSQDYYNKESLCWPGAVKNGCFENTTADGLPVTALDFHNNKATANSTTNETTEYSTTLYTQVAANVINAHAAAYGESSPPDASRVAMTKPLFLYLPYQAVHVGNIAELGHPYETNEVPQRYIDPYRWVENVQRRNLSGMVAAMDEAALNVTKTLRAAGMWKDTIFIFSTDNGGPENEMASNYPLRGGKGSLWEGGVRGVGFIAGGDLATFGFTRLPRVSRALMHVSDWNPTLCELVGGCPLAPAAAFPLDGVSAAGLLKVGANESTTSNRTSIVHDLCLPWMGGSCLEHLAKVSEAPYPAAAMYASIAKSGWKLTIGQEKDPTFTPELYHIAADPAEQHNVAQSNAAKVAELLAELKRYEKGAGVAHDRDPIDPRSNPHLHGGVWVPWE